MNTSKKQFVDTNIFIYTLFDVDKKKQAACVALFIKAAQGNVLLWTTEWVIAELVWFLAKQKQSWSSIQRVLEKLLVTKGLEVHNKDLLEEVIHICKKSRDFNDGIHIALSKQNNILTGYSYDKGLDAWKGFTRQEP